jgi:hypothetical protein
VLLGHEPRDRPVWCSWDMNQGTVQCSALGTWTKGPSSVVLLGHEPREHLVWWLTSTKSSSPSILLVRGQSNVIWNALNEVSRTATNWLRQSKHCPQSGQATGGYEHLVCVDTCTFKPSEIRTPSYTERPNGVLILDYRGSTVHVIFLYTVIGSSVTHNFGIQQWNPL